MAMENQKCLKIVMFKPVYLIQLGQNGLLGLNVVKHVEVELGRELVRAPIQQQTAEDLFVQVLRFKNVIPSHALGQVSFKELL